MSPSYQVTVRFFPPPADMCRYFTTFYCVEMDAPPGERVTDLLHPEWGNLRFYSGDPPEAQGGDGGLLTGTPFAATGPSSKATRFTMGAARLWGVGFLPLGWAKYIDQPAASLANAAVDGFRDPAFARFVPLAQSLFGPEPDCEAELARLTAYFADLAYLPIDREEQIVAIHDAMVDPDVRTVGELVERSGKSQRTVERVCHRAFGFAPKLLLRRQRFMRSLAQFMLDPSLKWIGAIDCSYHDQAQFVRDFHEFIGMTPRRYAKLDKPIIAGIMRERASVAGAAVQTLDGPRGLAAPSGAPSA